MLLYAAITRKTDTVKWTVVTKLTRGNRKVIWAQPWLVSQCERRSSGDLNIDIEVIDIEVDSPNLVASQGIATWWLILPEVDSPNLVAIQGISSWCPPLPGQLQSTLQFTWVQLRDISGSISYQHNEHRFCYWAVRTGFDLMKQSKYGPALGTDSA